MRRSVFLPLAAAAALLTATGLLTLALTATGGESRIDAPESASTAVVLRFYDAANVALATGDAGPLRTVLDPGFTDHAQRASLPPTGDGLISYLLGLHTIQRSLRLIPQDVVTDDARVAARVRLHGYEEASGGLGVFETDRPWGILDTFRVDGGRVVEHWGDAVRVVPEQLARVPLPASLAVASQLDSPVVAVQVRRLLLGPMASISIEVKADTVLLIEEGRLDATFGTERVQLGRGAGRSVSAGVTANLSNIGEAPAVALLLALAADAFRQVAACPPQSALPSQTVREQTAAVEVLTEGRTTVPLTRWTGEVTVTVTRVTLAPGSGLIAGEQIGLAFVVVESGSLDAGGVARGSGAAVALNATQRMSLRNAGEGALTLLAITVGADESGPSGASSSTPIPTPAALATCTRQPSRPQGVRGRYVSTSLRADPDLA